VVVTRGADGAEAFTGSGKIAVRASTTEVVDSTAAGDVFAAGLVHALVAERALRSSLETAVAWGTACVACHGLPGPDAIRRQL
jgi:sugar/nucleoside kinase (ribokinase family)